MLPLFYFAERLMNKTKQLSPSYEHHLRMIKLELGKSLVVIKRLNSESQQGAQEF